LEILVGNLFASIYLLYNPGIVCNELWRKQIAKNSENIKITVLKYILFPFRGLKLSLSSL
jgi:hypothetical protein